MVIVKINIVFADLNDTPQTKNAKRKQTISDEREPISIRWNEREREKRIAYTFFFLFHNQQHINFLSSVWWFNLFCKFAFVCFHISIWKWFSSIFIFIPHTFERLNFGGVIQWKMLRTTNVFIVTVQQNENFYQEILEKRKKKTIVIIHFCEN